MSMTSGRRSTVISASPPTAVVHGVCGSQNRRGGLAKLGTTFTRAPRRWRFNQFRYRNLTLSLQIPSIFERSHIFEFENYSDMHACCDFISKLHVP
ncbi:predicted protein [Arabidopsis lyrata subsp. lyrata]|uniref:Predicted protein n=1 Tax=Arabidopsis lyrata subsp. lyrata TaxID=81972 RepID=D7KXJ3_ARALL|nr:predicted protein [Arabidopsis lyrata subsp. lyrata]